MMIQNKSIQNLLHILPALFAPLQAPKLGALADSELGPAAVEALQEDAGLADALAADEGAPLADAFGGKAPRPGHLQALARVDDVEDDRGADLLQLLQVDAHVAAVGVRRVDALRAEVEERLETGVEDDLLLVGVLERFAAGNAPAQVSTASLSLPLLLIVIGDDVRGATQASNVPAKNVHQNRLGDVVRIVPGGYHRALHQLGAPLEGLAAKDAAEGAVVADASGADDLVHRPAVEVLVGEDLEGQGVVDAILLDRLQRVVPVAGDALVDGQQLQVEAVVVAVVQQLENVGEHGGV